jgi:hypothetical protein
MSRRAESMGMIAACWLARTITQLHNYTIPQLNSSRKKVVSSRIESGIDIKYTKKGQHYSGIDRLLTIF